MKININKQTWIIGGSAVIAGLFLGWLIFHRPATTTSAGAEGTALHSHETEQGKTIWTCSMHPQIRMDEPGQCPICGMDLIPLDEAEGGEEEQTSPGEIVLTASAVKLADVQTSRVREGVPERTTYLLGKVMADERRIANLTARFGGRIEKLFVNFTGQKIRKGEKLASIYSPGLVAAQQELLEATKYKESNPAFYRSARIKLKLWDLTDAQINDLEEAGKIIHYFDVLSTITGTVTMRHVAKGDYVKEGGLLFQVIDLSHIWVQFEVYEEDLPWIHKGDQVSFTIRSLPRRDFSGRVTFIDPVIHPKTRVALARVELGNPGETLKPGMFADGKVRSVIAGGKALLIPKSSVLWTGKRSVVYVKVPGRQKPTFLYREITLGPDAGNYYIVESGLSAGEEIATNGVFKIDAAAQLSGKPSMMNPEGGKVSTGHNHAGMKMDGGSEEMTPAESPENTRGAAVQQTSGVPEAFRQQLTVVVDHYLKLKDALVAGDEEQAKKAAEETLQALEKVNMGLLTGKNHNAWMEQLTPIKNNLKGIVRMDGVEMKREHFRIVSDHLAKAIKAFGIERQEPVYIEFCPMANNNKGAIWISQYQEIKNPYFGKKMLTCGEIKDTVWK